MFQMPAVFDTPQQNVQNHRRHARTVRNKDTSLLSARIKNQPLSVPTAEELTLLGTLRAAEEPLPWLTYREERITVAIPRRC